MLVFGAMIPILSACEPTTAVSVAADANSAESAQARAAVEGDIPGLSAAAEAIGARLDAAWAAMDPDAYAANFATDVRFISPIGGISSGRTAVRNVHFNLFNGIYKNSVRQSTVTDVLFLTGNSAVVELLVDLTGFTGTPPGLIPTTPTLNRTRERLVLVRRSGTWEILRGQITVMTAGVAGL
jgi:uncharacterized protein (TIGR02246 family)